MSRQLTDIDRRLLAALEDGLAVDPRPYARLAGQIGVAEETVLARLAALQADGTINRFGVVVRHHELGYRSNAMVVWDVPDAAASAAGRALAALPFVTLSYRRPRRPPLWPYNLFCMIHGRGRAAVMDQIAVAAALTSLRGCPYDVLFSQRRFKQRGARYGATTVKTGEVAA